MMVKSSEGAKRDIKVVYLEDNLVYILDQRLLPEKLEFIQARNVREVAAGIRDMAVRGAPAIGATAALGMAKAALDGEDMERAAKVLKESRPTAYDLFYAVDLIAAKMKAGEDAVKAAQEYVADIVERCRKIGENGEPLIPEGAKVLTHCNAGALATVDHGTALAPIRAAHNAKKNIFVWVDETRPWLQGARLTAWEMVQEDIPHAVIADNAAGYYMQKGEVDIVITGADRVASNGDAANKIGTYEKAVVAKECGIPFYIAAPISTFDKTILSGKEIPIEERGGDEVGSIFGRRIIPEGSPTRNPAFDVTPVKFIKGFITEYGVIAPEDLPDFLKNTV